MGRRTRNRDLNNEPSRPAQKAVPAQPVEEEESRPLWPFLAALGLVVVILAYIFLTADRGVPGPTNAQKVRTLTEQYVEAYNAGDQGRLAALSCAGLAAEQSPLEGEPKGVAIKRMHSESPEPEVATAEVTLTIDGKEKVTEWWYRADGEGWLVCSE